MIARSLLIRALVGVLVLSVMVVLGVVLTAANERAPRPHAPDRITAARAVSDPKGRGHSHHGPHAGRATRERGRSSPAWRSASI